MKTVALITLGCAKNLVDSEVMLGRLDQAGFRFTDRREEADIIIINTCGFIQPARDEAESAFRDALRVKELKPEVKIISAGCYVERSRRELAEKYPEIDAWLGVGDFADIVLAAEGRRLSPSKACYLYDHTDPRRISTPSSWAYLKISEGCSHKCSFCAIPLIKGDYRSREISSIYAEAEDLAGRGRKEINLISQDSTYWGRDLKIKNGLAFLLKGLLNIRGLEWIRVLYGYPEEISDPLLEVMAEKKVCSYFDIPFQHSHPAIIRAMKRGRDGDKSLKLLEKIRAKIPDAAVRTSLIIGFPGEGKEEFNHLLHFVKEARFNHLGLFTYSPEEGTACRALGDPVSRPEKEERRDRILSLQSDISLAHNKAHEGRTIEVLFEGYLKQDPTVAVGRAGFQAPEVDGVVFMELRGKRPPPLFRVEINQADVYDLYGEIIA